MTLDPPSTTRHCPVRYDAPGVARNATTAATSSGVPERPTGVRRPCSASSEDWDPVAIQPGATALQVTPRPATSTATARVSPTIPALAAAYDDWSGIALTGPVVDATFTTRPQPEASMSGRNR